MFVKLNCERLLEVMAERKISKLALCSVAEIPPITFGRYLLLEACPIRCAQAMAIILKVDVKEITKEEEPCGLKQSKH